MRYKNVFRGLKLLDYSQRYVLRTIKFCGIPVRVIAWL